MREYSMQLAAATLEPGRIILRAFNHGDLDHQLTVVALPNDLPGTLDEQLRGKERLPTLPIAVLPVRRPGHSNVFALDLPAGRYGVVCFVRGPAGMTHARKGMSGEFLVVN